MTKSNDGWVPELGEEVLRKSDSAHFTVKAVQGEFTWLESHIGGGLGTYHVSTIIPIKTEAEKRRDEQLHKMQIDGFREYGYSLASSTEVKICRNLLDAGWIKLKPLTDEVISSMIVGFGLRPDCEEFRQLVEVAAAYVCGEG